MACLLAAGVSVFIRYRRSAAEERLQLKWFASAAALNLVLLGSLVPLSSVSKTGQLLFDMAVVAGVGLALPVAIGVEVLKYRLYAIDKFSVQLSEQVDLDVLGADLLGVVHHVLAPEHLALWLNDPAKPAAGTAPPAGSASVAAWSGRIRSRTSGCRAGGRRAAPGAARP